MSGFYDTGYMKD